MATALQKTSYQGMVLDGRHRLKILRELGKPPRTREWDGAGSPANFVVSKNLMRRHLDESQRAVVAERLANLAPGRPSNNAQSCAVSQDQAADLLNVSRRSVQHAKTVRTRGMPELIGAVMRGDATVSAAAELAQLDPAEQARVVKGGPKAIRDRAKKESRSRKQDGIPPAAPFPGPAVTPIPGPSHTPMDEPDAALLAHDGSTDTGTPGTGPAGQAETGPSESEDLMADEVWLKSLPPRAALEDASVFDEDALLWRKSSDAREHLLAIHRPTNQELSRSTIGHFASRRYTFRLAFLLGVRHPRDWRVCPKCDGAWTDARGRVACGTCFGKGYEISVEEPPYDSRDPAAGASTP